jgi:aminopeptidase N
MERSLLRDKGCGRIIALCGMLFLAVVGQGASAQNPASVRNVSGGPLLPEQAAYHVAHYDLALKVDPATKTIDGALTVDAKVLAPLDKFVLDLDPILTVKAVTLLDKSKTGRPLLCERREGRLWIALPSPEKAGDTLKIKVAYGGKPRIAPRPPWDDGFVWSKTPSGEPWIAVTCEGTGADVWWPCKDHPSDRADTMDVHITVPETLFCAASGHLVGVRKNEKGWHTYDWAISTPINNYAMSINIAPYKALKTTYTSTTGEAVPVVFYALPQHEKKAQTLLQGLLKMTRFLEKTCGPYPFRKDKIGVAEVPYLGMEHQTITAYGDQFLNNAYGYDWLLFHEFAHEWFANLVTNADWKDMWIHEGFATYLEALYAEDLKGAEGYRKYMQQLRMGIENRRPVAVRETQNSAQVYVDNDIYTKGACILGTLRSLIGDKAFFVALRRMAYPDPAMEKIKDGKQCHFATTDDFLAISEAASGQKLAWFFEVYIRQPKLPKLVSEIADGVLKLRWQVPDDLPFPMPVDVKVGGKTVRVPMADGSGSLPLNGEEKPVIDPDKLLLRAP